MNTDIIDIIIIFIIKVQTKQNKRPSDFKKLFLSVWRPLDFYCFHVICWQYIP